MMLFCLIWIGISLMAVFIASGLYEYRDCLWFKRERERKAFLCQRCYMLFSGRSSKNSLPCPTCQSACQRLRF